MKIPKRKSGRQPIEVKKQYDIDCKIFASELQEIQDGIGFKISARGWGYYLEGDNLINKSEFNVIEKLINNFRKEGLLPIDFTSKDKARAVNGLQSKDFDISKELIYQRQSIVEFITDEYTPILLSSLTNIYIEVIVEKVDLVGLFSPVCSKYQIPITNLKGYSDINSRADIIKRCYDKHKEGCEVMLFYCGDFDPAGINISNLFKKNLKDLEEATGVDTSFIQFHRFGLNYKYIIDNNLVWTDNLITGSGKDLNDPYHKDHKLPYVQNYINQYGVKKVEANALLKNISKARDLMLTTINTIVKYSDLEAYNQQLQESKSLLLEAFNSEWNIKKGI